MHRARSSRGRSLVWPAALGTALLVAASVGAAGCRNGTTKLPNEETTRSQWSHGVWVYGQKCAGCHGENAEGYEDTPALAGEGALPREPREGSERTVKFDTALDVFQFAQSEMPVLEPGSLGDKDLWAALAYAFKEGGVYADSAPLNGDNATSVKLR